MINKFFFIIKSVILLTLIINISLVTCYANPIPVFCMAGWVDTCMNHHNVTEYEYAGSPLKHYSISGSSITEYEYAGGPLKHYSISGSSITEYEYAGGPLKSYSLH